ncbi:MAG: response regulator [Dehalococcoidales bacterium]|jgi:CheY-like chemotaxis protein
MEIKNNRKRILAIDDEPVISRVSLRVLKSDGFEVDIAGNGLVAKEMTGKTDYDLYLCDIRMPEMNGMEFYEYLRQVHPGCETRVIFVSGDTMNNEVRTFLSGKKNLFLVKPFTPEELRAVIQKALKQRDK